MVIPICSCTHSTKIEGLKYRTAGSHFIGDLGQSVMIERAGANHVIPLSTFNLSNVEFRGTSGKVYQKSEKSFSFSATLKPVSVGSVVDGEGSTQGGGEDGQSYYSSKQGSHVVFFPADYHRFLDRINAPDNLDARERLYRFSKKHNRAVAIVTRVTRVYGHKSTVQIAQGLGLEGKYTDGEFETSVKFSSKREKKLEDGAVSGYLAARVIWAEEPNPDDPQYQLDNLIYLDNVGVDHPWFRWLNIFVF